MATISIGVRYRGQSFETHGAGPADRFLVVTADGRGRMVRPAHTSAAAICAVAMHRGAVVGAAAFWLPAGPAPYREFTEDEMADAWRAETAKAA